VISNPKKMKNLRTSKPSPITSRAKGISLEELI
jgi:hypothetical protein